MRSPTELASLYTGYAGCPDHRAFAVRLEAWNSDTVMLVLVSKNGSAEVLLSVDELGHLFDVAEREAPKW